MKSTLLLCFLLSFGLLVSAEDGYRLWMRYDPITDKQLRSEYQKHVSGIIVYGNSATVKVAREELSRGLSGLLGRSTPGLTAISVNAVLLGKPEPLKNIASLQLTSELQKAGEE